MKRLLIVLLVLFVFGVVCEAKKQKSVFIRPAWVDDPKAEYPELLYLAAVGSGSGRQEAQNTAMGNLARIFEANVKSSNVYNERYQELIKDNKTTSESNTELTKSTTISADQKLLNMEIGPSWTDNLGQVYTIAYLDRQKTADIYTQKIDANAGRILYYQQQSLISSNIYYTYAALSAACVIADANKILLDQLAIISSDALEMLKLSYNYQDLKKRLAEVAGSIHFAVNIADDDNGKISAQLTNVISELGFGLNPEYAIQIKGKILVEDVNLKSAQKFVRYTFSLDVIGTNGISLFTMADTGREGHVNVEEARARALRTITGKIQNDFKIRLIGYFDALVQKK